MTTGTLLRQARHRAGLTQSAVAQRAGTSQPVISAYERDRRDPSVDTLRRLLRATGSDLELTAVRSTADLGVRLTESEHARRLVDVLLLADALPSRRRGELRFPRLASR